ncbi:MAG: polysaccharide pyruvyl transferase family protein [Cyclobacteriaceae bacterium]|nr:polysaccharide pyruvyl transferase family protein [Cyclobacteriaceae bacterium]
MECPVCLGKNLKQRVLLSREDRHITIFHCGSCTHTFQDPDSYRDIYSSGEFTRVARGISEIPDPAKIKALDKKAWARFNFYYRHLKNCHHVLEAGSSIGSFLHLLKLDGKSITGIEPDPNYCEFSKDQYFLEQEPVLLDDFQSAEKFNGICSFHVIEHVRDLHGFMNKIYTLLQENGKLLIECPSWEIHSFGSKKHTVWQPHLHYFTLASMYRLLSKKFKITDLGFFGIALYVCAEYSGESTYDRKTFSRIKRRSAQVHFWNEWIPRIKLGKGLLPLTTTQLILQPILQETVSESITKLKDFGIFALKERLYRAKESGWSIGNKALHLSYFSGFENAGDTVLSKCVRDSFRTLINIESWKLRPVTAPVTSRLIREINSSPFLLVGGGGLLLPDSNPNSKSGWQWAVSRQELDAIEVPIVVYGIGYNYFLGQEPQELFVKSLIHIIKKSKFFSLRNHGSINAVKKLIPSGLHPKLRWQPCPTTLIRHWEPGLPNKPKTKNIAINVAYDRYWRRFGKDMYTILDQLALALKAIAAKGYNIYNVCHLKDDAKFEISLNKHKVPYQTVQLQFALPRKVYEIYNQMDLVMGLRGHAQMIPFGVNCKIISLGSHHKVRYFLEDIQALDWFVDLREEPTNIKYRILDTFEKIYQEERSVNERLLAQQQKLMDITAQNAAEITDLIR